MKPIYRLEYDIDKRYDNSDLCRCVLKSVLRKYGLKYEDLKDKAIRDEIHKIITKAPK